MYKFTNLDLTEEEFFNLHFMNPPTRQSSTRNIMGYPKRNPRLAT